MTPQDAARILAPIRIAFLAARIRVREQREDAQKLFGSAAYRALADLDAAEEYLMAREVQWDFAGLLSVAMRGDRPCTWPNVIPDPEAMAASLDAWTSSKPELREKVEALLEPQALPIVRRLSVGKAVGA